MEHDLDVGPTVRTLSIICAAILMSVPVYAIIAILLNGSGAGGFPPEAVPRPVVPVLVVAAALLLLSAPSIGRAVRRPSRDMTGGATDSPAHRLERFRTGHIMAFALRETAAILGLVVTLVTGNVNWVLGLGAAAMIAMLLGWPRRADARRLVKSDAAPLE